MNTSKYNIYIELPNTDDVLIVHGYTGAIDLINQKTFLCLKSQNHTALSGNIFTHLQSRGYITILSEAAEYERCAALSKALSKRETKKYNYTFIVAYDCNFRCPYCYESKISNFGSSWTQEVFDHKLTDAAFSFIENSFTESKQGSITLCGGEPLLKKNYEIVSYIIRRGIEIGFEFSAITNGFELESYAEMLGAGKISHLQITLDGDREVHNRRRLHYQKIETFDKIVDNISLAISKNVRVSLRINVDKDNFQEIESLVDIFDENKWTKTKYFKCYLAPKRSCKKESTDTNEIDSCSEKNELLSVHTIYNWITERQKTDPKYSVINPPSMSMTALLKDIIYQKKSLPFKGNFCGATSGSNIIFDPRGDIYTCLDFVGMNKHSVGQYFPTYFEKIDMNQKLNNRKIYNLKKCSHCKYALFCGGGCLAQSYNKSGNIMISNCDQFPMMFNKSLAEAFFDQG